MLFIHRPRGVPQEPERARPNPRYDFAKLDALKARSTDVPQLHGSALHNCDGSAILSLQWLPHTPRTAGSYVVLKKFASIAMYEPGLSVA